MENMPSSRAQAIATGAKYYFTGRTCHRGHLSPRFTKGVCVACGRENNRKWVSENLDKARLSYRKSSVKQFQRDPVRAYFYAKRSQCRVGGIEFDFDLEYLRSIFPKDMRCPVLGLVMEFRGQNKERLPTIDRVDPAGGYIKGNVVIMSFLANRLKSNVTDPEIFRALANWLETKHALQV